MKLLNAYRDLLSLQQPVICTTDAAACLQISIMHSSKILKRLCEGGQFIKLARGRWAVSEKIDPLLIPEYLTAPFPSYISLQTALYYHGMISQIPAIIYSVSIARTRTYATSLGTFSIHHMTPNLLFGFESFGKHGVKMATPEKALIDIFYLSPTHSFLFKTLPEIEIPQNFKTKEAWKIVKKIPSLKLRTLVSRKLKKLLP